MAVHLAPVKPSVMIYCEDSPAETLQRRLREVEAGLEEEGIPFILKKAAEQDPVRLAHRAAGESALSVGVGIGGPWGVCIHYSRFQEDQPLFLLKDEAGPAQWRCFGYNAARLVKGTPFKEVDESPAEPAAGWPEQQRSASEEEQRRQLLNAVVKRLLQEPAFAEAVRRWKLD
ncbi:MAG TPA: glycerol dehydratase reactivase beta/small subunit family protein [Patescibacteria group bacterium]|nr:glycerol dehydratase reactivase beta/small subunit family protein [Patescibacteria group bacterium]